jgi:hypothetical protein
LRGGWPTIDHIGGKVETGLVGGLPVGGTRAGPGRDSEGLCEACFGTLAAAHCGTEIGPLFINRIAIRINRVVRNWAGEVMRGGCATALRWVRACTQIAGDG